MGNQIEEERMRRARWAKRREEMRRRKRRQELFRRFYKYAVAAAVLIIIVVAFLAIRGGKKENIGKEAANASTADTSTASVNTDTAITDTGADDSKKKSILAVGAGVRIDRFVKAPAGQEFMEEKEKWEEAFTPKEYTVTEDTILLGDNIVSKNALFVDLESGTVLARKGETGRIVPASMTKVLTLLVAVEHIDNFEDKFEITSEITDYCLLNDCSNAGFLPGETVTIKDLLYATVLPSGADGALGLAFYAAGSQEAFVALMNEKLEELGLSDTAHFTNCVGIYEDNHYCTLSDLAVIMEAAVKNKVCREVLSAHTYTTSLTKEHPDGITISNWFLRRIEDKEGGENVLCGKTGYVRQSEHCAVSFGMDGNGREYICVTANAAGNWRCIEDHAYLYQRFAGYMPAES